MKLFFDYEVDGVKLRDRPCMQKDVVEEDVRI